MENIKTMEATRDTDAAGADDVAAKIAADAGAAKDAARDAVSRIKDEGVQQIGAVKEQAQDALRKAGEEAKSFATEHKDAAGTQFENIAEAIAQAADTLEGSSGPVVAGYARDLAGGLKQVSSTVKSRNVEEIVGMVQDFGKQQPLAFLGAAALAGFIASRFILSSGERAKTTDFAAGPTERGATETWSGTPPRAQGEF